MKEFKAKKPNGELYRGVYYREHPTRKHGLFSDKYYLIRYWARGKTQNEGIGWASGGVKPSDAEGRLIEIKAALNSGSYETPAEKKEREKHEQAQKQAIYELEEKDKITFQEFWKNVYYPAAEAIKRAETSRREGQHFRTWLKPVIGKKPLKDIAPFDLRRVRSDMTKKGRSPRTQQYVTATFRQAWNMAKREGLVIGDYPGKGEKFPTFDNARTRFLTKDEAITLLNKLKEKSVNLHDQALLSLHCGLRFGEVASLTWGKVDFKNETLFVDGKGGFSRYAFMTQEVRAMLGQRNKGQGNDEFIFKDTRHGGQIKKVSNEFFRTLKNLEWNKNVADPRQRICFHTLRHTFCSWHVEAGTPLYHVAKLAGHKNLTMTQRYSHLAPDSLRSVTKVLNGTLTPKKRADVISIKEDN